MQDVSHHIIVRVYYLGNDGPCDTRDGFKDYNGNVLNQSTWIVPR